MPIYEYRCTHCEHQFDVLQKMGDHSSEKCEKCGNTAERQVSRTSFVLKGNGWYATDYAGKKAHGAESAESPPPCATGACNADTCPKAS